LDITKTPRRILIADDQSDLLAALRILLRGEGFAVTTVESPQAVLAALDDQEFDVALVDLNYSRDTTSGQEGFDLLTEIQRRDKALPVLVMTAWGSVDGAVEALNRGARDYITKPWENERLLLTLETQIELAQALRHRQRLELENERLRASASEAPVMIAKSAAMRSVLDVIERVGPSDASVLITGEHGTGKEVVARVLHAQSNRRERPLVTVNAGGLSDGVFESELFGHVKGAFTDAKTARVGSFELADQGTLFLDELANMPLPQQAKVLRVLQTGELHRLGSSKTTYVDVRLITATNADLAQDVREGRFREDLLYRVNTVEVALPALRERREDIPHLAAHFLATVLARYRRELGGFREGAMRALQQHGWPGNVRELQHVIERSVLMARGHFIEIEDLGLRTREGEDPATSSLRLEELERDAIKRALTQTGGNVSSAAESLGLSRSALYRRLERYGLGTDGRDSQRRA
jgi:DNA-binding NtrC family response regulator